MNYTKKEKTRIILLSSLVFILSTEQVFGAVLALLANNENWFDYVMLTVSPDIAVLSLVSLVSVIFNK